MRKSCFYQVPDLARAADCFAFVTKLSDCSAARTQVTSSSLHTVRADRFQTYLLIWAEQKQQMRRPTQKKTEMCLPLTTTSVAIDTLSTFVWTAHVYFPACLGWMFRIIMSPAERCPQKGRGEEKKHLISNFMMTLKVHKCTCTVRVSLSQEDSSELKGFFQHDWLLIPFSRHPIKHQNKSWNWCLIYKKKPGQSNAHWIFFSGTLYNIKFSLLLFSNQSSIVSHGHLIIKLSPLVIIRDAKRKI